MPTARKDRELDAVRALFASTNVPHSLLHLDVGEPVRPGWPDALASTRVGRQIAVEVVTSTDEALAAGMSALQRLEREVEDRLAQGGMAAHVQMRTREGFLRHLSPREIREATADKVVNLVHAHQARPASTATYDRSGLRSHGIEWLSSVRIHNDTDLLVTASAPSARFTFVPLIQMMIDKKNHLEPKYRSAVGGRDLWLLIVAGESFESGIHGHSVRSHRYTSAFDRTFLLDHCTGAVTELVTTEDAGGH